MAAEDPRLRRSKTKCQRHIRLGSGEPGAQERPEFVSARCLLNRVARRGGIQLALNRRQGTCRRVKSVHGRSLLHDSVMETRASPCQWQLRVTVGASRQTLPQARHPPHLTGEACSAACRSGCEPDQHFIAPAHKQYAYPLTATALDAALLGRPASVVRHRRRVHDLGQVHACSDEGGEGRLPPHPDALDLDRHRVDAHVPRLLHQGRSCVCSADRGLSPRLLVPHRPCGSGTRVLQVSRVRQRCKEREIRTIGRDSEGAGTEEALQTAPVIPQAPHPQTCPPSCPPSSPGAPGWCYSLSLRCESPPGRPRGWARGHQREQTSAPSWPRAAARCLPAPRTGRHDENRRARNRSATRQGRAGKGVGFHTSHGQPGARPDVLAASPAASAARRQLQASGRSVRSILGAPLDAAITTGRARASAGSNGVVFSSR